MKLLKPKATYFQKQTSCLFRGFQKVHSSKIANPVVHKNSFLQNKKIAPQTHIHPIASKTQPLLAQKQHYHQGWTATPRLITKNPLLAPQATTKHTFPSTKFTLPKNQLFCSQNAAEANPEVVITIRDRRSLELTPTANWSISSSMLIAPHPKKVSEGLPGEDNAFISTDGLIFGVADGVGGWVSEGIDPGKYSAGLMEWAQTAYEKAKKRSPLSVLQYAWEHCSGFPGSSTVCLIQLEEDGPSLVANSIHLGDSGYVIIRDGSVIFRTDQQVHGFNYPFQLGPQSSDEPSDGEQHTHQLQNEDIIITATDGVFDNLFRRDFEDIISSLKRQSKLTTPEIANGVLENAVQRAHGNDETPFSKRCNRLGFDLPPRGKVDDISVIASIVRKIHD